MSSPLLRRLGSACVALLVIAGAPIASTAQASTVHRPLVTRGSTYLALGDSVSFGYEEASVVPAPDYADAASFINFPQIVGQNLGLHVVNLACPGETSGSFINASAPSNGCESAPAGGAGYRTLFPLHVKYTGSQLQYAMTYLKSHRNVRLISLMIGANDAFLCQGTTSDNCASELGATAAKISTNVGTILSTLRHQAHYAGQIVIVDYYSLDYAAPTDNAVTAALNTAMNVEGRRYGAEIANSYGAFATASVHSGDDTCTAGLLTQLGMPGACGVHPSVAGQTLLASTLEGAITFG
jgi:lysophospholipase L1-like esterase